MNPRDRQGQADETTATALVSDHSPDTSSALREHSHSMGQRSRGARAAANPTHLLDNTVAVLIPQGDGDGLESHGSASGSCICSTRYSAAGPLPERQKAPVGIHRNLPRLVALSIAAVLRRKLAIACSATPLHCFACYRHHSPSSPERAEDRSRSTFRRTLHYGRLP